MSSRRPSAERRFRPQAGFTLVELMIGVLIGLLATLAVTHVLVNSEGQKRSAMSGSDAQVNGALALSMVKRSVQSGGYGFAANPGVIGCPLTANYKNAAVGMPANLVPVIITHVDDDTPDTIRVFSSGKKSFSLPVRMVAPGYVKGDPSFTLSTIRGIEEGDLLVAANTAATACELFQVTKIASATVVDKENGDWNANDYPVNSYTGNSMVINLGVPLDVTYSVVSNSLRATSLNIAADGTPSYDAAPVELFPNIVNMRALYGKDNNADGSIDVWDAVTPATNADWLKVVAVRLALVSRSAQYEKDALFADDHTGYLAWNLGQGVAVTGSADCVAPMSTDDQCLKLKVSQPGNDWKHYRYRVYDTVIPLRNMLWNS